MFYDIVRKSRSYRKFDNSYKVTSETLNELIKCVRLAPAGANQQNLRYLLVNDNDTNSQIFAHTKWGALYKDWNGPTPAEQPTAYIVICSKKEHEKIRASMKLNLGIAAQTIALAVASMDLGCCMIGNFQAEAISKILEIENSYNIELIIAIGKGDEEINISDIADGDSFNYYRDENGTHTVPKLTIDELIIK